MKVNDPVRVKGRHCVEKVSKVDGEYVGITRTMNKILTAGTFDYTTWYTADELEAAE